MFYLFADDGLIDESDLREVMKACMVENGMEFDEKEVSDLANALFEDAVQVGSREFTKKDKHPKNLKGYVFKKCSLCIAGGVGAGVKGAG